MPCYRASLLSSDTALHSYLRSEYALFFKMSQLICPWNENGTVVIVVRTGMLMMVNEMLLRSEFFFRVSSLLWVHFQTENVCGTECCSYRMKEKEKKIKETMVSNRHVRHHYRHVVRNNQQLSLDGVLFCFYDHFALVAVYLKNSANIKQHACAKKWEWSERSVNALRYWSIFTFHLILHSYEQGKAVVIKDYEAGKCKTITLLWWEKNELLSSIVDHSDNIAKLFECDWCHCTTILTLTIGKNFIGSASKIVSHGFKTTLRERVSLLNHFTALTSNYT